MSIDEQHVALPQALRCPGLCPAIASRPGSERPFDPDELPIEAERTEEEREFTAALPEYAWTTPGGVRIGRDGKPTTDEGQARPRKRRLRGIGGRFRSGG